MKNPSKCGRLHSAFTNSSSVLCALKTIKPLLVSFPVHWKVLLSRITSKSEQVCLWFIFGGLEFAIIVSAAPKAATEQSGKLLPEYSSCPRRALGALWARLGGRLDIRSSRPGAKISFRMETTSKFRRKPGRDEWTADPQQL